MLVQRTSSQCENCGSPIMSPVELQGHGINEASWILSALSSGQSVLYDDYKGAATV